VSALSDGTIRRLVEEGRIKVDPWDPALVQPSSIDMRLGNSFRVFHNHRATAIDLRDPPTHLTEEVVVADEEPFVIHPGEFCLGRTLEWVELPEDVVARVEGKALAVTTEIPTPDGWRFMADLEVGDLVFDRNGHPAPVLAVSDVMVGRECREVAFSDGTTITADLGHQWVVREKHDRSVGRERVLTTGELERRGLRAGEEWRFNLPQALVPWPAGPALEGGGATSAVASHEFALAPRIAAPRARIPSRAIVGIRPCESVPVKCIQVGTADGVFLASSAFIPTHNSSLGRLGLIVHATAGFVDPGWKGTLTLEFNNLTRIPIKLYSGLPIAQLSFMELDAAAERPYGSEGLGSHYQGQVAATESRYLR